MPEGEGTSCNGIRNDRQRDSEGALQEKPLRKQIKKVVKNREVGDRTDYEFNHTLITDAFAKILLRTKRKPMLRELAEETGLHINTIDYHLKNLKFEPANFKAVTDKVVSALSFQAMKGEPRSVKLYLQFVEGFRESQQLEHSGSLIEKITFVEDLQD